MKQIERQQPLPTPILETISPSDAERYLKTQMVNRPLNPTRVVEFGIEIEAGRWVVNGETIKFTAQGNLFDGQHRLEACILAKKPFITWVIRGIEDDRAFATVDVGKTRTHADLFALSGFADQNNASACAMALYLWKNGCLVSMPGPNFPGRTRKAKEMLKGSKFVATPKGSYVTKEALIEFVEPYRHKVVEAIKSVNKKGLERLAPRSLWAVLYILFSEKDTLATEIFFIKVGSGEGLQYSDPALTLRNKLQDIRADQARKLNKWAIMLLIIKAWNAYRTNQKMLQLKLIEHENFPRIR